MDFELSPDQLRLRDQIAELARKELRQSPKRSIAMRVFPLSSTARWENSESPRLRSTPSTAAWASARSRWHSR